MAQFNFAKREVACKVVYYGPAESGKTANLRAIHERTPAHIRGNLTSIATDGDRTLFFDFLPLDLGEVAGIRAKINLYAVPYKEGQNAMRLLVLEGADGIVFVADSSRSRREANREALQNLLANLAAAGRNLSEIPLVFQWNKSDMLESLTPDQLRHELDVGGREWVEAVATSGRGVIATLKAVTRQALEHVAGLMAARAPEPAAAHESLEGPIAAPAAPREPAARATPKRALQERPLPPQPATPAEGDEIAEPIFHPAWHRKAPSEDTSTHSGIVAELQRKPLRSFTKPKGGAEAAPEPERLEPPVDRDEPLEIARDEPARDRPSFVRHESAPEPPAFVLDRVDELKIQSREAERAPIWEETPESDSFAPQEPAPSRNVFGATGFGGPAVPKDADDEKTSHLVTVGGGGARRSVRTVRQRSVSWERDSAPRKARDPRGRPIADRRKRPRMQWRAHRTPLSQMTAGAVFALLWLAATGYLVKELL